MMREAPSGATPRWLAESLNQPAAGLKAKLSRPCLCAGDLPILLGERGGVPVLALAPEREVIGLGVDQAEVRGVFIMLGIEAEPVQHLSHALSAAHEWLVTSENGDRQRGNLLLDLRPVLGMRPLPHVRHRR